MNLALPIISGIAAVIAGIFLSIHWTVGLALLTAATLLSLHWGGWQTQTIPSGTVSDRFFWGSICWQLFLGWIPSMLLHYLFDWTWLAYSTGIILILVLIGYVPAWTNRWFIQPKENHIAVLSFSMVGKEMPVTDEDITRVKATRAMRAVVGPVTSGRTPFMNLANGRVINTARATPLGGEIRFLTQDNVPLIATWYMPLTAIATPEAAIRLAQMSPSNIEKTNRLRNEGFIQDEGRKLKLEEVFAGLYVENGTIQAKASNTGSLTVTTTNKLEGAFTSINGGKDVISPFERENATFTGNPVVTISLDADVEKAFKAQIIAQHSAAAIQVYQKRDGANLPPRLAANMDALNRGLQLPNTLFDVSGLPPGAHLILGDIADLGRK